MHSNYYTRFQYYLQARCHRIGQSKNVTIYRLITRRSFESEMFQRASKKLGLEQAVLGTRNFNDIDQDENAKNNAKVKFSVKIFPSNDRFNDFRCHLAG